ncbi:hypothetical protein ACOMHN_009793 [Nucella lapillus]
MTQLPSHRASSKEGLVPDPKALVQEMQGRKLSVFLSLGGQPQLPPMGGTPGGPHPKKSVVSGFGGLPVSVGPSLSPATAALMQRKLTISDVRRQTEMRAEGLPPKPVIRPAPKQKQSVYVPLEELRQVAGELRVREKSEVESNTSFKAKGSASSVHVGGKVEQQQKAAHFRERLKSVAVPIAEKKAVRAQYVEYDETLAAPSTERWETTAKGFSDLWKQIDIWSNHFKEIEGRFGSATASYFRFTRWLIVLNFFTFLVVFLVITAPFLILPGSFRFTVLKDALALPRTTNQTNQSLATQPSQLLTNQSLTNQTKSNMSSEDRILTSRSLYSFQQQTINCSAMYSKSIKAIVAAEKLPDRVLDMVLGTGWMETTSMFYGFYHNRTFAGEHFNYNMGLAYLLAIGITFLISFILILVNSSQSVKELVKDDQEQSTVHFTNNVLCGWDYSIFDEKTACNRRNILFQEFKADLLEQNKRQQQQTRTQKQKVVLLGVRAAVNIVALCVVGGSLFLIYYTTTSLLALREKTDKQALLLMIQFLPSVTITILNTVIPEIFNILVTLEDYRPAFELKITLMRTVFVRLSSLGVLTLSLYYTLLWSGNRKTFHCPEEGKTDSTCCGNLDWPGSPVKLHLDDKDNQRGASSVLCWETYVGQQFYKLAVVDFAALMALTFFVEFPRKFIYDHFKDKSLLVQNFGQQEFDLPKNVLDIVYSQTLGWLGTYFAPMLPMMTFIKIFIVFYIKKLTLMKNFAPPQHVYKVSKSNSFFNIILLISFILVAAIIGYLISSVNPSKSCGPYRLYSVDKYVVWTSLQDVIAGWPQWVCTVVFFFGTKTFFVPCFVVLCLLMYYYWALGQGYGKLEEILREKIKLEDKDRQFLLERVNDMIRHGYTIDD